MNMKEDEDLVVNNAQGSSWSETSQDDTPFFADMTLDLAEAHDIAVTPEATRKQFVTSYSIRDIPKMPSIPDDIGMEESASADVVPPFSQSLSAENSYDNDNDGDNNNKQFFTSIANPISSRHRNRALPSARRWPRDVKWAVAFLVVVPLSLLLPILFCPTEQQQQQQQQQSSPSSSSMSTYSWMATAPAPRLATWHTLVWGYVASLVLSRLLYRTIGGGDGDDARHVTSQILLLSAPISVSVYALLVVVMYALLPHAWLYLCVPLWYLARDVFLFRSWKMTATTPGGRQAFFQALTCMTLDILSRSLRRSSFYRIVSLLVVVQLVVIAWWRWALLAALKSHSMIWILMAALGGKWATGTVARLLTLIASGGIQRWFAEQDSLVQNSIVDGESPRRSSDNDDDDEEDMIEFSNLNDNGYTQAYEDDPDEIPEAYRTADASMYKSALAADDGIDDDFDDELDEDGAAAVAYSSPISGSFPTSKDPQGSMVKQLLFQGLSRSFGSVAKCGLLGGNAQFLWSQIRKIDTARATFQNLQGMPIGHAQDEDMSIWSRYMLQANLIARSFVRNNSDMAMSHVAAFSKSYQRAAQDVAILIDESGVEPMIHEDISTHMSSCVGGSISGLIVVLTGFVLVHQRNRNHPQVEDSVVFLDMLMAFVFCYTLIFTVMEPLRASIKAVYVSFAQYPHALSQSFPLIYHRLKRMSESNLQ